MEGGGFVLLLKGLASFRSVAKLNLSRSNPHLNMLVVEESKLRPAHAGATMATLQQYVGVMLACCLFI